MNCQYLGQWYLGIVSWRGLGVELRQEKKQARQGTGIEPPFLRGPPLGFLEWRSPRHFRLRQAVCRNLRLSEVSVILERSFSFSEAPSFSGHI